MTTWNTVTTASHKVSPDAAKVDLAALLSLVERQRDREAEEIVAVTIRSQAEFPDGKQGTLPPRPHLTRAELTARAR